MAESTAPWSMRRLALVSWVSLLLLLPPTVAGAQPPNLAGAQADALEKLARNRFANLTQAELRLVRGAPSPALVWCGPSSDPDDPANRPDKASTWGSERTVRSALLRWLAVDPEAARYVDPSGVGVAGARMLGRLDLSHVTAGSPLTLFSCSIADGIELSFAELRALDLRNSWVGPIEGTSSVVHGDVLLRGGSYDAVDFFRARIDGTLDCTGGRFLGGTSAPVSAIEATIGDDALFHDGFVTNGFVDFRLAHIGGGLSFNDARFTGSRDNGLNAERATVGQALYWVAIEHTSRTQLDLANATAAALWDDAASWPASGKLFLNGFVYGSLEGGPSDAAARLDWLSRQPPGYAPQPYLQLAKVLRQSGHEVDATEVLIAKEDAFRRLGALGMGTRLGLLVLKLTIGYGYKPLRALWWMVVFVVLGSLLFGSGYQAGVVTPTHESAYQRFVDAGRPPAYYPPFNSLVYSLENFLPLVDLHQGTHWRPNPQRHMNNPQRAFGHAFDLGSAAGTLLLWYLWLHIIAGWVLTPLFVAGLSGLVRTE